MTLNLSAFGQTTTQPTKTIKTSGLNLSAFGVQPTKAVSPAEAPAKPVNKNSEEAKAIMDGMLKSGQATTAPITSIPPKETIAQKFTGFVSSLFGKKPESKPMEFKVGEGLSNTTTVAPGPRISTLDAIKRGEDINVVPVSQPTKLAPRTEAKQTLDRSTEIAKSEEAAGLYKNKDAEILSDVALSFPKKILKVQKIISDAVQPTPEDIAYSQNNHGLTKGGQLLVKNPLSKSGYTYLDPLMGSMEMENVAKNLLSKVSKNIAESKNIVNITRNLGKIFKGDSAVVNKLAEHFVNVDKPAEVEKTIKVIKDTLTKTTRDQTLPLPKLPPTRSAAAETISKELEPLAQEATKYKSAEELYNNSEKIIPENNYRTLDNTLLDRAKWMMPKLKKLGFNEPVDQAAYILSKRYSIPALKNTIYTDQILPNVFVAYRGFGGEKNIRFRYPVLGKGKYYAFNYDSAKQYGKNVDKVLIAPKKLLRINNDNEYYDLTKKAGMNYSNTKFLSPKEEKIEIDKLNNYIIKSGYDAVYINVPSNEHEGKLLGKVFGTRGVYSSNQMFVVDNSIIRNESQLTDIWNKANQLKIAEKAKPKIPVSTPAEIAELAQREQDLTKRETELSSLKEFQFTGHDELENQYQSFKPLIRKIYGTYDNFLNEAEDWGSVQAKASKKGILGDKIDNLVYSQENTGDEVLQMFKDRLSKEVGSKGEATYLKGERSAVNKEAREQAKIQSEMEKRGLKEAYTKMRSMQKLKSLSDNQLKRVREKFGATEWKNTSKAQLGDMYKELAGVEKGGKYLTADQSKILMERDKSLTPDRAIMTEKQAYQKYGFYVPPSARGGMHAPILHLEDWNDKMPFSLVRETMERNLEDVAGKEAEKIKDFLPRPIRENETMRIQWIDENRKKIKNDIIKNLNIKPRSLDDALIQMYGEGRLVQEELFNETTKIMQKKFGFFDKRKYQPIITVMLQGQDAGEALSKLSPNIQKRIREAVDLIKKKHTELLALGEEGILKQKSPNNWKNIKKAVPYFRNKYDSFLEDINTTMKGFDYEPVPKRNDYFRHFQDVKDWDILGVEELRNYLKEDSLPTSIAGKTEFFRPGRPFTTVIMKREGNQTSFSAIAGLDNYLEASSRTIFHTDSLQRVRALEKYINTVDEATKHKMIKLQNFNTNLAAYANQVSGKKGNLDRIMERNILGRAGYSIANWLRQKVGKNMIAGNVSSAIMNFIPFTQSLATSGKVSTLRALNKTILTPFKKDFGVIDGVASKFLRRRFSQETSLAPTFINKASQKAGWLFGMVDRFTSHTVVTAKYYDNIKAGMNQFEAMANADEYAGKLLADRSIGNLPNIMTEKTLGFLTQFQVEVNNLYSFIKKDIPRMNQGDVKKTISALTQFAVYSWLANSVYEQLTGRRPTIDPIDYIETIFGVGEAEEDADFKDRLFKAVGDASENLPFSGSITPFLGKTGSRFPMAAGFPNLKNLSAGQFSELYKPLAYYAAPFGGGQIKKTAEGIAAYKKGTVESKSGKTDLFNVEKNATNFWKMLLFGKWATPEAGSYFKNQELGTKDNTASTKRLQPRTMKTKRLKPRTR